MTCESTPYDPNLARLLSCEVEMRRNDDHLRRMLQDMEASDDWLHLIGHDDEADETMDIFHAKLMVDEALLEQVQPGVYRMTSKGHDFVSTTRDPDIWTKSKGALTKLSGYSVTMLGQVAEGLLRAKLREVTGIDI